MQATFVKFWNCPRVGNLIFVGKRPVSAGPGAPAGGEHRGELTYEMVHCCFARLLSESPP